MACSFGIAVGLAVILSLDLDGRSVAIRHSVERGKGVARIARPKTDRGSRTLVLSNLALRAIEMEARFQASERELAGDRWQDLGLVFASRTGTIQARAITGSHLRARLAAAGLPPIRWHGLRRLFGALLLDQGVPLHRIRDLLGHTNVGIAEHCAYTVADALARDMGAVDRALGDELG